MKTMLKFMAMAAIVLPMMISCSGDENSKSPFGSLPELFQKCEEESEKLHEEVIYLSTDKEKAEFLKKCKELEEKWYKKIEKAAKKLDGKKLELGESDIKVTEPITLQFTEINPGIMHSVDEMSCCFDIKGSAETAYEIIIERNYNNPTRYVYLVGYNDEGQKVFSQIVGTVESQDVDDKSVVRAGAPITFDTFHIDCDNAKDLAEVVILKLEADE